MTRFTLIAVAIAASLALAPATLAETKAKSLSAGVAYGDLDLSRPAGGKALLKRIQAASRRVCKEASTHSPLEVRSPTVCRREATADAVRRLDLTMLTLAWNGAQAPASLASR